MPPFCKSRLLSQVVGSIRGHDVSETVFRIFNCDGKWGEVTDRNILRNILCAPHEDGLSSVHFTVSLRIFIAES